MSNKKLTLVRAYDFDKLKLKDWSLELSNIQKSRVSTPEVLRRVLNIPELKELILVPDAYKKRRLKVV